MDFFIWVFLIVASYSRLSTLCQDSRFSFIRASSLSRRYRRIFQLVIARLPPAPSNITNGDQKRYRKKEQRVHLENIRDEDWIVAHYILLLDVTLGELVLAFH